MIRAIVTLLKHDLAVAFKNKTLCLIIGIPLFVYATLTLVDSTGARDSCVKVALLETDSYEPVFLESIKQASDLFIVSLVSDEEKAMRLLKNRDISGILREKDEGGDVSRLRLTVVRDASMETLIIMQHISALQAAAEGGGQSWIAAVRSLETSSVKQLTLPTWILMMVLLVGFIVLPAQVAEEKEKQLLLGWMQTPVRESEWLVSKLAYGIVLILASVAALHMTGGMPSCSHMVVYFMMLCAGGFCFGAMGICLGLLCRNQASARTIGILCYLPLLLPAGLSDMSQELRNIAPLIPSYYFYQPVRAMLLEDSVGVFARAWISLVALGMMAFMVSHQLIKKRWLM